MLSPLATLLLALAPGHPHVRAVKTAEPPVIEGRLDDPAWKAAIPSRLVHTAISAVDGGPPSEHTTLRVLYDAQSIYVGVDCEQVHSPILEHLTRRDRDSESEWVAVQIDPRNEGKVVLRSASTSVGRWLVRTRS